MSEANERKKQPDVVRRSLIDRAAELAMNHGLQGMTVQAVADAAGVTKGGLFHHFSSKEKLVEAVLRDQIDRFAAKVEAELKRDGGSYGCFTRAYVIASFALTESSVGYNAVSISNLMDPKAKELWASWYRSMLKRHAATDSAPELEIVRYAADGVWLSEICGRPIDLLTKRKVIRKKLLELAQK